MTTRHHNLAAYWRPRRLRDVVGQRDVVATLTSAAAAGTIPQQILLYGPSGLGKTTLARAFAAALLCEQPLGGDSCGTCATCVDVAAGTHPDVIELDAASNGGIEQIRALGTSTALLPLRGGWRVLIIDEAHGLSGPGIQAFLKLLEEPPDHNVFVLATTEPDKLGVTIRGRCLLLRVKRPSDEEVAKHLEYVAQGEGADLDDAAALALVAQSDEQLGVRGALMNLERVLDVHQGTTPIDVGDVANVFGHSATSLQELGDVIGSGDRDGALEALARARVWWDDEGIHSYLEKWAKRALDDAMAGGGDVDVALFRLRECLSTPAKSGWTELLVAGLAQPELVTRDVALREVIREAQEVGDGLRALLDVATFVGDAVTIPDETVVSVEVGNTSETSVASSAVLRSEERDGGDFLEENEMANDVGSLDSSATTRSDLSDHDAARQSPSDIRVQLLNAVSVVSPRDAVLLARGALDVSENGVAVTGLFSKEILEILASETRALGVALTLPRV